MALNEVLSAANEYDVTRTSYDLSTEGKELQDRKNRLDAAAHAALAKGFTSDDLKKQLKPGFFERKSLGYERVSEVVKNRKVSQDVSKDPVIGNIYQNYMQKNKAELEDLLQKNQEAYDRQHKRVEDKEIALVSGPHKGKKVPFDNVNDQKKTTLEKVEYLVRRQKNTKQCQEKADQLLGALFVKGLNLETRKEVADRYYHAAHKNGFKIAYPKVAETPVAQAPAAPKAEAVKAEEKKVEAPVAQAPKAEEKKAAEVVEQKAPVAPKAEEKKVEAPVVEAPKAVKAEEKKAAEVVEQKVEEKKDAVA